MIFFLNSNYPSLGNRTDAEREASVSYHDMGGERSFYPFVSYLIGMGVSMSAVLLFLTIGDMKESKYRSIEKKLRDMESSMQVG